MIIWQSLRMSQNFKDLLPFHILDLILSASFFKKKLFISFLFSIVCLIIFTVVLCAWNRDERINEAVNPAEAAQCTNFWEKILKSFSLQNNWRSLMDETTTPNSINVINGIK